MSKRKQSALLNCKVVSTLRLSYLCGPLHLEQTSTLALPILLEFVYLSLSPTAHPEGGMCRVHLCFLRAQPWGWYMLGIQKSM